MPHPYSETYPGDIAGPPSHLFSRPTGIGQNSPGIQSKLQPNPQSPEIRKGGFGHIVGEWLTKQKDYGAAAATPVAGKVASATARYFPARNMGRPGNRPRRSPGLTRFLFFAFSWRGPVSTSPENPLHWHYARKTRFDK